MTATASAQGVRLRAVPRWTLQPGDVLHNGAFVITPIDRHDAGRFIRVTQPNGATDYRPIDGDRRLTPEHLVTDVRWCERCRMLIPRHLDTHRSPDFPEPHHVA